MATSVVRALQLATLLALVNIAQAAVDPPPAYKQIALPKGFRPRCSTRSR